MICDQCLNEIKSYSWYNNMRLCKVCLHNAHPWKKKRCTGDSCPVTLLDLKKKWEKK
jgi:hypothetical protein